MPAHPACFTFIILQIDASSNAYLAKLEITSILNGVV
jgi:hypothetical protein